MGSRETLELLTHLEKDAWTVKTNEPKANWSPLDIAVYFNNRNFVSSDGDISNSDQLAAILQGLTVGVDSASKDTDLCLSRANSLKPAPKTFQGSCDGCLCRTSMAIDLAV